MNNGFSLFEQTNTNQELKITYQPPKNTSRYTYEIIKNDRVFETYEVSGTRQSEILLYESGTFQIRVTVYTGINKKQVESGKYHLDMEKPIIRLRETTDGDVLTLIRGKEIRVNDYIIATDNIDGEITGSVTSNLATLDTNQLGLQDLVFTVTDGAGNMTEKVIHLNLVRDSSGSLLGLQIILLSILTILLGLFFRYRHSVHLEKRLAKYSVEAIRGRSTSVFEHFAVIYHKWNHKLANSLKKSVFLERYSRRYEKYIQIYKPYYQTGMDFIANKLIISILFLLIAVTAKTMQYQMLELHEIFIPFIVGFFAPDILYYSKYKIYRNTLENDLLQAIIIMNNAFKSGRSITQAIDLVTKELKGTIAEEFKKMSLELSFGLSIDQVFGRFSDRIQLEEITYLTASLTILNQTGGNIIQVFSSIEQSLFNKKKLKLELASLTGSSKLIAYLLYFVPFIFILFIGVINPTYFEPFYQTQIGIILACCMIVIYAAYIVVVQKIMKVRM